MTACQISTTIRSRGAAPAKARLGTKKTGTS